MQNIADRFELDSDTSLPRAMPWYKFGTRLTEVFTAKDAVRAAKLDWEVIVVETGTGPTGHRLLVRDDVRSEDDPKRKLAEVRSDYQPIQNLDAFAFFDPIVKAGGAIYDCIGTAQEGRLIWMTVRMQRENEIAASDVVARFVLLVYRHGTSGPIGSRGGKAPTMSCKPVRLACKSTLDDGLLYPLVKVKVTPAGITELEDSPSVALDKIDRHFDELANRFRAMLRIQMSEIELRSYLDAVFPKAHASGVGKYRDPADRDRAIAECVRLFAEGKGNDLPAAKGSLWAAYSAVAEYVDYYETRPDDPQRLNEIWGSPLKTYAMGKATKVLLKSPDSAL